MRLLIFSGLVLFSFAMAGNDPGVSHANEVNSVYEKQLGRFKTAISTLHRYINSNNCRSDSVKIFFLRVRSAYKELSVITDWLNPYETILLNSPALARTEDDNPTIIIPPRGLQQLEALTWEDACKNKPAIEEQIRFVDDVIVKLETEAGRMNKFTTLNLWESIRAALVTIAAKTITSFDSPVSLNGISESQQILKSISSYFSIYRQDMDQRMYDSVSRSIKNAMDVLETARSFDAFDRASFLKNNLLPLSSLMTRAAFQCGGIVKEGKFPVDPLASNIFSPGYFNVDFFSPTKRYAYNEQRRALGKALFFDTRLSSNGNRSCASCHQPSRAFTDGLKLPVNINGTTPLKRNTPTLLNAFLQTKQFYDSRQTLLEFQVSSVVHNEQEMGGSTERMAELLQKDNVMASRFAAAYPDEKQPVNQYTVTNAIANYLRSLSSLNSKFDRYMRNENVALTASEKNGFNLFMGKAKCGTCHFMPLFNGLVPPQFNETESEVIGVPASAIKPATLDADSGRYYFTKSIVHLYSFKIPSLRNIALTAPYMHNGVFNTLDEVIDFYNNGGGKGLGVAPPNQSLPFEKLQLSKKEKKDIIAFLQTLTDTVSYKMN